MDGLKENLIYIIQIYDNKFLVKFNHKECTVYDSLGNIMVKGNKFEDSCYCVSNPPKIMWNRLSLSTEELW